MDIVLSEINQSQNDKYCVIPLRWEINVVRFIETKQNGGSQELEGEMRNCLVDTEFSFVR